MLIQVHGWRKAALGARFFDGGTGEIDLNDPKVKAAIAAAVATETEGLRKNRDDFRSEKEKLAERLAEFEKRWEPLKAFDPTMIASLMSKFEKDEEAKLIAEGKLDEVLNRRTEAMRKDAETRITAATAKLTELEARETALNNRIAQLVIGAKVREAAIKVGLTPTAIVDAERDALSVFSLDDHESPVMREGDGKTLVMGKDGKTPKTPAEWLEGMREAKPHWWPPSAGGGAGGSGGGTNRGGKGPDLDKMTPRQKLQFGLGKQAEDAA